MDNEIKTEKSIFVYRNQGFKRRLQAAGLSENDEYGEMKTT
jgi:hypothetical protein